MWCINKSKTLEQQQQQTTTKNNNKTSNTISLPPFTELALSNTNEATDSLGGVVVTVPLAQ
jgi:hypothetical protein